MLSEIELEVLYHIYEWGNCNLQEMLQFFTEKTIARLILKGEVQMVDGWVTLA